MASPLRIEDKCEVNRWTSIKDRDEDVVSEGFPVP